MSLAKNFIKKKDRLKVLYRLEEVVKNTEVLKKKVELAKKTIFYISDKRVKFNDTVVIDRFKNKTFKLFKMNYSKSDIPRINSLIKKMETDIKYNNEEIEDLRCKIESKEKKVVNFDLERYMVYKNDGLSDKQIANRMGITHSTLINCKKEHNLIGNTPRTISYLKLENMLKQKRSLEWISDFYQVDLITVEEMCDNLQHNEFDKELYIELKNKGIEDNQIREHMEIKQYRFQKGVKELEKELEELQQVKGKELYLNYRSMGLKHLEIAELLGISSNTLSTWKKSWNIRENGKFDVEKYKEMKRKGKSMKEIAKAMNMNERSIYKVVHDYKVKNGIPLKEDIV